MQNVIATMIVRKRYYDKRKVIKKKITKKKKKVWLSVQNCLSLHFLFPLGTVVFACVDPEGEITSHDGYIEDSAWRTRLVESNIHGALVELSTVRWIPIVTISTVLTESVGICT